MNWLGLAAMYLGTAGISYFMFFTFGVEDNCRVGIRENLFLATLRCVRDDFFRIHCPWSKARSIRYRIAHLWDFVGESGQKHDKLGYLTRAELVNPHRHAEITNACFVSRTRFWAEEAFSFLISPIRMALYMIFMLLVMMPVALYADIRAQRQNKAAAKDRALKEKLTKDQNTAP